MLVSGFPPSDHVVIRAVKFAKYLPEYGWHPHVLTARAPATAGPDFMAVPPSEVTRTPRWSTPSILAARLSLWWRHAPSASGPTARDAGEPSGSAPPRRSLVRQLLLWGDTPDSFAGWVPCAVGAGWRRARAARVSAIYASGPPFSVVLAGAVLARLTALPLVADFRDAWVQDPQDPFGALGGHFRARLSGRRVRVQERLEGWCVRRSAGVLFTSRSTLARYGHAYPELAARFHLIYNGADPDDFGSPVTPVEPPTVAHVGTVHDYQWPQVRAFLAAFAVVRSGRPAAALMQVAFVGAMGDHLRARLKAFVEEVGLGGSVRILGLVKHSDAVAWMRGSRLLILFAGGNPYIRLSKISEYVASGVPMLALAEPESDAGRELKAYGGRVVSGESGLELEQALADLLSRPPAPPPCAAQAIAHPHPLNRRTEAQELARILDALVESGR